jgi:hypothetical protein
MDEPRPDALIAAHIESMSGRTDPETALLISTIMQGCWPGGTADRSDPCALEWVRRWAPRRIAPPVSACSCLLGRCSICN